MGPFWVRLGLSAFLLGPRKGGTRATNLMRIVRLRAVGGFLGPSFFLAGELSHGGSWISSCFFWLEGCTRLLIAINSHLSIGGRKVCVCETLIFLFGDFFLLASCSDTLWVAIYHWGFPNPDCVQITTPRTLPRYYPKNQLGVVRLTPRGLPRYATHYLP